jgi:hypothetical protein
MESMSTAAEPASPRDVATPVDQHQRAIDAEIAQIEQVQAGLTEAGH